MPLLLTIDATFFNRIYMGERVVNYIWFAGIIIGTLLLKRPITSLLMRVTSKLAMQFTYMQHRDAITGMLFKPLQRLLLTVLFFVATEQISGMLDLITFRRKLNNSQVRLNMGDITDHIFLLLFIIFLTQTVTHFIDFIYYLRMDKAHAERNGARQQLLPLIKEMSKLLTWVLSVFWLLGGVFHVNIPALITGLGIGGVAIALAGKETVENFFAAFTILTDKPFQTGEVIKLGEIEGEVERIGFRSTRVRNMDGSVTTIPNQHLVSQNLINLSAREKRVMKIVANIRYGITHAALQEIIDLLREELGKISEVKAPLEIYIDGLEKETLQLHISYSLPHPLSSPTTLIAIKSAVNMKVFEIISSVAELGTPPATTT